ncbi:MAG: DUF3872 domain-containing protein [Bacteroidaceae bacterium]
MKRFASYILYTLLLSAIVSASFSCHNDDLDIRQDYLFDLVTMPVQKKIVKGNTAEIRCQLKKEGDYSQTTFYIRYFQPDGEGELKLDDGRILLPNDLYILTKDVFRLYYTSQCTDQQTIDVYIEDSFGQVIKSTFSFQNESGEENEP